MKFLTTQQLTRKLGIFTCTAYRRAKEKKIPGAYMVGGAWCFREDFFYKSIEEETSPSEAKQAEVLKGV